MSAAGTSTEPPALAPPAALSARAPRGGPLAPDALRSALLALARVEVWSTLLVAGFVCALSFYAKAGLKLSTLTTTEMVMTLLGGVVVLAAVLLSPTLRPVRGGAALALLLAFTALSALSVAWSVQPDESWHYAARLLSYSALFAATLGLVRLFPERWPQLLEGIVLGTVIVSVYAIASKTFPSATATAQATARLQEPFGYWNAIGLTAAMGVIACMWLGARRDGHAAC